MRWRPRRPQVMGTTWGPHGGYGDDVGMMGMTWGQHGDDRDNVGTMGTTWGGDHRDNGDHRSWGPHGDLLGAMGMMWGQRGWHRDDMGTTRMMWGWRGQRGDHGDNKITKNAITFERIEIIEFCLKIWDPWTLPHTCRLQLMCRWGSVLSQMQKVLWWPSKTKFSCFCTGSH